MTKISTKAGRCSQEFLLCTGNEDVVNSLNSCLDICHSETLILAIRSIVQMETGPSKVSRDCRCYVVFCMAVQGDLAFKKSL